MVGDYPLLTFIYPGVDYRSGAIAFFPGQLFALPFTARPSEVQPIAPAIHTAPVAKLS